MQNKYFIVIFLFLFTANTVLAQKDGYWDKTRATTEEISVSARDRIVIKTQDFPEGTTEVVYRIKESKSIEDLKREIEILKGNAK